jgi:ATP-dependent DNA helicase RecQ
MPGSPSLVDLDRIAATVFGIRLREPQRRALAPLVAGRDTLAVLPTGSGKSAIYQVAGLALGGLTVVISPLIALQRDQLRTLAERGRPGHPAPRTAMLNSSQHRDDRRAAVAALDSGELDFLFLGPEQLHNPETHQRLLTSPAQVRLFVVDEAHLVSQWGHDFRPEYLRVPETVAALGRPRQLALTATAAPPVQVDITRALRMDRPAVVVTGFDRPNLSLAARAARADLPEAQAVDDRVVEVVIAHETPALVYALSHERCESIAERLRHAAFTAAAYHAGLPAAHRASVQDRFFRGSIDVVVATSAFGMGIDKPNVRTVVHAGVPGSLDEYYQEIGRAGRDGAPAAAVLVHDPRTIRIPRLLAARSRLRAQDIHAVVDLLDGTAEPIPLDRLIASSQVPRQAVERVLAELSELGVVTVDATTVTCHRLPPDAAAQLEAAGRRRQAIIASRIEAARSYAETSHCRRAELLAYFGDQYDPPCGRCDNDAQLRADSAAQGHADRPGTGRRVRHRLWGDGTLLHQDEHELIVVFDAVGYRTLTAAALTNGLLVDLEPTDPGTSPSPNASFEPDSRAAVPRPSSRN